MKKFFCFLLIIAVCMATVHIPMVVANKPDNPEININHPNFSLEAIYSYQNDSIETPKIINDSNNEKVELFASTASGTCGDNLTWTLNGATQTLTISGNGAMDDYAYTSDIPWYSLRDYITIVTISEGVTTIGQGAFYMCTSLTRVSFPSTLIAINDNAFTGCISLLNLALPSNIQHIGGNAFYYCIGLSRIVIPNTVSYVGLGAFEYCIGLIEISLSNKMTEIPDYAFYGCENLLTIIIPNNVTLIGKGAFYKCSKLSDVSFSVNLLNIDESAFQLCIGLQIVKLPQTVKNIGVSAFALCNNLTEVCLSEKLENISAAAFYGCENLKKCYGGSNITSVGNGAFYGCYKLEYMEFPHMLSEIDSYAFYNCKSLNNVLLYSGIIQIPEYAFYACESLSEIIIPETVTYIGDEAFAYCINIEEINIPNKVKEIGEGAFGQCCQLKKVQMTDSVEILGEAVFAFDYSLQEINLSNNITTLNFGVFGGCSALEAITLPKNLTDIGEVCFGMCTSIKSISIPSSLKIIGEKAFYDCPNLSNVYYGGTKNDWKNINISNYNDILETVNLMTTKNNSLNITINDIDVIGGIAISLSSDDEADIYYTINGEEPCSASTLYSQPFTIDEAGTYIIKAIAYSGGDTYGNITEKNIVLDKSTAPVLTENNGYINARGNKNIYYTKDFTVPTASDYLYETAIPVSRLAGVTARCIELGKAGSEPIRYISDLNANSAYSITRDSYRFPNYYASFGYKKPFLSQYTIPKEQYQRVYGITKGQAIFDNDIDKTWGGSCFGMSATSLMFYKKYLDMSDYSDNSVYSITAPQSAQHILTKLIEQFQIMQYNDEIWNEQNKSRDITDIIERVQNFETTGQNPIILILSGVTKAGDLIKHAVVPYKIETVSSNKYRMYIYDCDVPYDMQSGTEKYIEIINGAFKYGNYTTMKYNDLNTMITGLNDVTLFSDKNIDTMLLAVNSNDVSIINSSGISVANIDSAVSYPKFDAVGDGNGVIWNLPVDNYTIENNDMSLDSLNISVADENCYYNFSSRDLSASIHVGISAVTGKLYAEAISSSKNTLKISTLNNKSKENTIEIFSDYAKFGYCNDKAVIVNSNADNIKANAAEIMMTDASAINGDIFGTGNKITMVSQKTNNIEHHCDIAVVNKPKQLNNCLNGTLTVEIKNESMVDENGILWVGIFEQDSGKLISITSQPIDNIEVGAKHKIDVAVAIDGLDKKEYELKAFYWDNNLTPLAPPVSIYYN